MSKKGLFFVLCVLVLMVFVPVAHAQLPEPVLPNECNLAYFVENQRDLEFQALPDRFVCAVAIIKNGHNTTFWRDDVLVGYEVLGIGDYHKRTVRIHPVDETVETPSVISVFTTHTRHIRLPLLAGG